MNPKTKQPYTGTTALCLGCHEDSSKGGQGYAPVSAHMSHPYGLAAVDPKIAKVPGELLREGGRFECLGCHDPHPSNPYYKYLRVDTAKGSKIDAFCAVCHPIKADAATCRRTAVLFTSMDETGNRVLAAKSAAESKGPARPPRGDGSAPRRPRQEVEEVAPASGQVRPSGATPGGPFALDRGASRPLSARRSSSAAARPR